MFENARTPNGDRPLGAHGNRQPDGATRITYLKSESYASKNVLSPATVADLRQFRNARLDLDFERGASLLVDACDVLLDHHHPRGSR